MFIGFEEQKLYWRTKSLQVFWFVKYIITLQLLVSSE